MVIAQALTFQIMVNVKCHTCILERCIIEVVHNVSSFTVHLVLYNGLVCKAAVPRQVYYFALRLKIHKDNCAINVSLSNQHVVRLLIGKLHILSIQDAFQLLWIESVLHLTVLIAVDMLSLQT